MAEQMESNAHGAPPPRTKPLPESHPDRLPEVRDFMRRGLPLPRGLVEWAIREIVRLRGDLAAHREQDAGRPCDGETK